MTTSRPSLNADSERLLNYLTDSFKADRGSLSASELVSKYGTHILLSVRLGAKLSIDYQAEYEGSDKADAVNTSLTLGLAEKFGMFSGDLDPIDSTKLKGVSALKLVYEAIGADTSKIVVHDDSVGRAIDHAEWRESITEENARFIYLNRMSDLRPLYELIDDPIKKEEVRNYIQEYLEAEQIQF